MKLWGGRFEKGVNENVNDFNSSISIDKRMYKEDIKGSIAHSKMLGKQNIIPEKDSQKIISGLNQILKEIEEGNIVIDENSEDIHTFIEETLTSYIGEEGKKLHTGRSRNDQVTLDTKLYLKKELKEVANLLLNFSKLYMIRQRIILYNNAWLYPYAKGPAHYLCPSHFSLFPNVSKRFKQTRRLL